MKIKKKFIQKVISVFASVLLLANSFTPYLLVNPIVRQVSAQEEITPTSATEASVKEVSTVTPEPTVIPTTEPTVELTPVETITPEPVPPQAPSQWTFEKVELNKEYVAPVNKEVKLTFTKLPSPSGNIKIEEITLTEDQIKQTGSLSDKAYDITSDMKDGEFAYNLSLPIPESSKGKAVEVKFAEDISDISSVEKVENTLTKTDTSVSVVNLDHFTIFVVTNLSPPPTNQIGNIFDNDDGSSVYLETGTGWANITDSTCKANSVNGNARRLPNTSSGTATFTFNVPTTGNYNVYSIWTYNTARATNATYTVNYEGGSSGAITKDQRTGIACNSSDYQLLGTYLFNSGSSYSVILSNAGANGAVLADAIKILSVDDPAIVYVDDNWAGASVGSSVTVDLNTYYVGFNAFSKIQDAIDAVAVGGTINVEFGTYIEVGQIVIDKDLSIIGEDKTTTIIKPAQDTGNSGDSRGWFLVNSGKSFTLKNVTLDGTGHKMFQAIRSHGPTTIENNVIKNMLYDPSTSYEGRGVVVYDGFSSNIIDNTIENIGRIGIFIYGTSTQAIVKGNTYIGKGVGNWLDYGVEVGGGGQATIENNTISNNKGVAGVDGSTSAGIMATTYFAPGTNLKIINNSIHDNSYGVAIGYSSDTTLVSQFDGNTLSNNNFDFDNYTVNNVDARNNTWSVTNQDDLDQIEAKINHYCSGSTYVHGVCSGTDDYGTGFGMVQYKDIGTPTNSGWNVNSKSATPNETPLDVACGGYTNENSVAQNWTTVSGTNIKYQREVTFPSNAISNIEAGSNTYTSFSTFGSGTGIEGLWKTRVKAYVDANSNNKFDSGEEVSGWSNECQITFDKTAPDAAITSPIDSLIKGSVQIRGTVTDTNPHHYWLVIQNSSNATVAGPGTVNDSTSFTDKLFFTWNTNLVSDGVYKINLAARDAADNRDSGSSIIKTVTVDNTAPTVDLVFPTPGSSAKSFQAVFSENVVESEAEDPANYFLNNWPGAGGSGDLTGDATIVYDSSTKTATVTFTNPGWYISPEQQWGVQDIHDLAGNLQSVSPYTEYSTPMVAPVTTDSGTDTNWHNTAVTVNLSCSDTSGSGCKKTYFTTDGSIPTTSSSSGNSITLNTDGIYTIQYFSVDNAGNEEVVKTASNTVKIDKTLPSIPSITTPVENGYITSATTQKFVWTASTDPTPGSGLAATSRYQYQIDNNSDFSSTLRNVSQNATSKTLTSPLSDGTYYVRVRAKDAVGNYSPWSTSVKFIVDSTAPTTPSVTTPITNGYINSPTTQTFEWSTSTDPSPGSGMASSSRYEYEIDNNNDFSSVERNASLNSTSKTLTNPLPDGAYYIRVNAKDKAGNYSAWSTPVFFTVDTTNPTTSEITAPQNNEVIKGIYTITANASDNVSGSGIDKVEFWHKNKFTILCTDSDISDGLSCNWDTTIETDNTHTLYINTYDKAGNLTTSSYVDAVIDNTAPTEPVATPGAGDYMVDQFVILDSSDSSSGIDKIYYTTDGTEPNDTKTEYTAAINVDKDMTIKAIAYDKAGNTSSILSAIYGIAPVISGETSSSVTSTTATITWTTDDPSTSRVVYDTVSHSLGAGSNYGYANSTVEDSTKVTSHSVGLTGLTAGTTYYYRTISHGSPESVSDEKTFATTSTSTTGDGGGTVAGVTTSNPSAPVCYDSKPGSAPVLLSAVAGINSVTLTWSKAPDPVSYYLMTFGTSPGAQTYGNPNIGNQDTTSYTVSGLSGGATYYFKVRAGNGCMPGDFSNELSSTPGGGFIEGIPAGFEAGVLGEATESAKLTGKTTDETAPTETVINAGVVKGIQTIAKNKFYKYALWIILILLLIFIIYRIYKNRNS